MSILGGVAGFFLTSIGAKQKYNSHISRQELESRLHDEEIRLTKKRHNESQSSLKRTFMMDKFLDMEIHFQQLNADLLTAAKETERELANQRNQQYSIVLVAGTIMISCIVTVYTQGVLIEGTSQFLVDVYALSNSASMAFLTVSILLCGHIVRRSTLFMYEKFEKHNGYLRSALKATKKMMTRIRGQHLLTNVGYEFETAAAPVAREEQEDGIAIPAVGMQALPPPPPRMRRQVSTMGHDDVQKVFDEHEKTFHDYLRKRERIVDHAAYSVYDHAANASEDPNFAHERKAKMPFAQFWRENCKTYASVAIILFYVGNAMMFIANMTFVWSYFELHELNTIGAAIWVIVLGVALVACAWLVIYMRCIETLAIDGGLSPHPVALEIPMYDISNRGNRGAAAAAAAGGGMSHVVYPVLPVEVSHSRYAVAEEAPPAAIMAAGGRNDGGGMSSSSSASAFRGNWRHSGGIPVSVTMQSRPPPPGASSSAAASHFTTRTPGSTGVRTTEETVSGRRAGGSNVASIGVTSDRRKRTPRTFTFAGY